MDACIKEYKKGKSKTKSTKVVKSDVPEWFNEEITKKELEKEEEKELENLIKKYE